MRLKFLILIMILAGLLSIGFADVSYPYLTQYGPAIVNWGNNVKYGGTLRIVGSAGPLELTLNPFVTTSSDFYPAIYESLFYVNGNGDITNLLGTSYKWINQDLTLVVDIRQNVKWSDGTPFTSQDVAFTFNYLKSHPSIDTNGIWSQSNDLQSVSASGDSVFFNFSHVNVAIFPYIAEEPIVPEHIWSKIDDPAKYIDSDPVGTGPFLFQSFSRPTNTIVFVKNPNYWMPGRPYVDKIIFTSENSNNTALLEMLKHNFDLSNLYIPDVENVYVAKDPANNKFFFPIYGGSYLIFNDTKYPFNIPEFRKALSVAIDRNKIMSLVYPGVPLKLLSPTLIPSSQENWIDPTLTDLASSLTTYNPQKAQEMLASIGFKKNAQGFLTGPDGKTLPNYTFNVPAGWTDWIQRADVMAQEFKDIGLQVTVNQESFGQYYSSLQTGTFDMATMWLDMGPTPYYAYYYALNSNLTAPTGKVAASNFCRYENPLVTDALNVYKSTSNLRVQRQAIYSIERIVLDDMPVVGFLSGPMWEVYNTSTLTGFPSNDYPYYYQGSLSQYFEIIALNVHLK